MRAAHRTAKSGDETSKARVGSMKQPRGVDFFTGGATPRKWTNVRMTGEFFTTVSSLNAFHPVLDVVAGGNSSGKVSIWR